MIQALFLLPYSLFSRFLSRKQEVSKCLYPTKSRRKEFLLFFCLPGLAGILVLITFTTGQAEFLLEADEKGQLHANLRNITLEEVSSFFTEYYDITFVGDAGQLRTEVTLSFERLSVEKALKKIFSRMNVALKYDSHGNITEVRVLPAGQKSTNPALMNYSVNTTAQALALEDDETEPPVDDETDQIDQGDLSADDSFEVVPNSPPSDDDFEIVPSEPPSGN